MNARLHSLLSVIFAVGIMLSPQMVAQVTPSCSATVSSPPDLSIKLIPHRDQTVFRQGEIIKLTIRYTSRSHGKYLLDNRSYDRSGRLDNTDLLCLQPENGTDPLDDYFHSYGGFMGGGLSSEQQIGISALTTELELNEWRSLPPGTYKLSILSNRVALGKGSDVKTWSNPALPVQSNWISFQVVRADPAWQSTTLSTALRTLESQTATQDQKEDAARVLRFLDSEDAARELAHRFWNSEGNLQWQFEAGLYGNPFRQSAIQGMRDVLRSSHGIETQQFIDVLVNLEMQSDPKFRQLRFGTRVAQNEKTLGASFEAEHKRRVAEYSSKAASGTFR